MKYLLVLLIFCCASDAHARKYVVLPTPGGFVKIYTEPAKPNPVRVVPSLPSYSSQSGGRVPIERMYYNQEFPEPLTIINPFVNQ